MKRFELRERLRMDATIFAPRQFETEKPTGVDPLTNRARRNAEPLRDLSSGEPSDVELPFDDGRQFRASIRQGLSLSGSTNEGGTR